MYGYYNSKTLQIKKGSCEELYPNLLMVADIAGCVQSVSGGLVENLPALFSDVHWIGDKSIREPMMVPRHYRIYTISDLNEIRESHWTY